jgi:hypothetical protein
MKGLEELGNTVYALRMSTYQMHSGKAMRYTFALHYATTYLFVSEGEVAFPQGVGHVLDVAPHRREVVRVALMYSMQYENRWLLIVIHRNFISGRISMKTVVVEFSVYNLWLLPGISLPLELWIGS